MGDWSHQVLEFVGGPEDGTRRRLSPSEAVVPGGIFSFQRIDGAYVYEHEGLVEYKPNPVLRMRFAGVYVNRSVN